MKCICIVEDEMDLNCLMQFYLQKEGYAVITCNSFSEAQMQLASDISVWVVDIMLPDGNGLDILKAIKAQNSGASVIIISAKGDRFDRVTGFEMGCDDYIAKPFLPAELVFRIRKLFDQKQKEEKSRSSTISLGAYEMDLSRRLILNSGKKEDITSREFDILLFSSGIKVRRFHVNSCFVMSGLMNILEATG